MLKEEIIQFLTTVMPFNFLSQEELETIIDDIAIEYYPRGREILTQGGPPSEHLAIIKKGGVKVSLANNGSEETVIDYRSEGEQFGLLSLVGGDRSRTNVTAVEDTICYLLTKEKVLALIQNNRAANEYFLKSFFIHFIDKTYEKTRKQPSGLNSADRLLYITPVGEIVHRQPVTTAQGISIKEAAARMARDRISSLIVVDDGGMPVGMLTDRDLREKVVAQGKDVTLPINSIMSSSLITIDALESCFEALLKMIRHKIHHILVMEDDRLKGMVTNHDFMTLQGASPTALVKDIEKAQSLDELCEVTARISRTVAVLLDNGAKAHNITGFITELTEKTLNRVVDFIEEQLGRPPCPSTLFLFGEAGRREMSLDFNLALGLIVKDAETDTAIPGDDRYFQALAEKLNRTLDLCFGVDRQYLGQANIRRFSDWQSFLLAEVTEANAGPRAKFLEMRCVRGRETEVIRLREKLSGIAAGNPHFIKLLAVASMSNCPPLGFFKHFVVEKTGEHTDKLNLYEKGIKPFIDITRLHALEHGSLSLATRDRLADLEKLHFEQAKSVASALDYLQTFLLRKQLAQIETGQQADNFVQPEALDAFEKKTMKESFHLITTLFEQLEKKFSTVR